MDTLYNYDPNSPTNINRENYNNVGAGDLYVGDIRRAFKGSTFEIWDAPAGGNQLVLNTDYELINLDNQLTDDAGYDVYSGYKIINAAYQVGNIYITYDIVMSYNDASLLNDIHDDIEDLNDFLTGQIFCFGNDSVETGFLLCDGSAVSRTTYSDLFAKIGTTWGVGDGATTFNLPDAEGAFLRAKGSSGIANMEDGNPFAGVAVGSFENDQFTSHYHTRLAGTNFVMTGGAPPTNNGTAAGAAWSVDPSTGLAITDGTQGARNGDETRPFAISVKMVIKY